VARGAMTQLDSLRVGKNAAAALRVPIQPRRKPQLR
jgi:hypothetical protein